MQQLKTKHELKNLVRSKHNELSIAGLVAWRLRLGSQERREILSSSACPESLWHSLSHTRIRHHRASSNLTSHVYLQAGLRMCGALPPRAVINYCHVR
jgi:hypothetical protein